VSPDGNQEESQAKSQRAGEIRFGNGSGAEYAVYIVSGGRSKREGGRSDGDTHEKRQGKGDGEIRGLIEEWIMRSIAGNRAVGVRIDVARSRRPDDGV